MPTSNLLALIDDIATLLDDVALMSKMAAKKTAGVLGDDLALNAQQVSGVNAERELPVVWAVAKGSFVNKAILVPAALGISWAAPWAIQPLLMLGGLYLCYEGTEKLAHKYLAPKGEPEAHHERLVEAVKNPAVDLVAFEKEKIKGAVRTDFILSAEIVVITLGALQNVTMTVRVASLVAVAVLMTIGVYGLVAAIVKLDDLGRLWSGSSFGLKRWTGEVLLASAPWLMKGLSVAGTVAMFLVGGGIVSHGIGPLHHWMDELPGILSSLLQIGVGLGAGALVLVVLHLASKWRKPAP